MRLRAYVKKTLYALLASRHQRGRLDLDALSLPYTPSPRFFLFQSSYYATVDAATLVSLLSLSLSRYPVDSCFAFAHPLVSKLVGMHSHGRRFNASILPLDKAHRAVLRTPQRTRTHQQHRCLQPRERGETPRASESSYKEKRFSLLPLSSCGFSC